MDVATAWMLGAAGTGMETGMLSISPPVLFFFLGFIAVLVRSNISMPEAATKLLSLYLLWAIGFKGGVGLVGSGFSTGALKALILAVALSVVVPVWTYLTLRRLVTIWNAAAIAACFGSVSVVTFLTACTALDQSGTPHSGHMVAVMAAMEAPAIVVALLLLNRERNRKSAEASIATAGNAAEETGGLRLSHILRESLLNGPVLLLLGSIVIGMLTGERGYAAFKPMCTDAFPGALAFFLLDLGVMTARRMSDVLKAPKLLVVFALAAPLVNAALAIAASKSLGIGEGDAILFAVLAASASYIAAPAALKLSVPKADHALYVALSLGVTFPFNIILGIPLYSGVVRWLW